MIEKFPCNNCGACCKSVHLSVLTDWLNRGDGVCKNFDESNNLCKVYDDRPDICNVRTMYDQYYKSDYTWGDFVVLNQHVMVQ